LSVVISAGSGRGATSTGGGGGGDGGGTSGVLAGGGGGSPGGCADAERVNVNSRSVSVDAIAREVVRVIG
jgi:hypothetical protein